MSVDFECLPFSLRGNNQMSLVDAITISMLLTHAFHLFNDAPRLHFALQAPESKKPVVLQIM